MAGFLSIPREIEPDRILTGTTTCAGTPQASTQAKGRPASETAGSRPTPSRATRASSGPCQHRLCRPVTLGSSGSIEPAGQLLILKSGDKFKFHVLWSVCFQSEQTETKVPTRRTCIGAHMPTYAKTLKPQAGQGYLGVLNQA
jgi:hypothetical protein